VQCHTAAAQYQRHLPQVLQIGTCHALECHSMTHKQHMLWQCTRLHGIPVFSNVRVQNDNAQHLRPTQPTKSSPHVQKITHMPAQHTHLSNRHARTSAELTTQLEFVKRRSCVLTTNDSDSRSKVFGLPRMNPCTRGCRSMLASLFSRSKF
jgi:hypothetical protein